jgi:hypothetical protein
MIRSKIAGTFRRATSMGIFWAWLALALHLLPGAVAPVHAQGTRKDDIVFNSRGTPLAGATVRVCAQPATGQPCSPLANIYSDPLLSQALANPTTTDGMGNYFFYAAPGTYEVEISGPQISTKQIPDVILPSNPASPTFSGAVSAFSLSLSGNLSVTGNTTVIGNFASGTINLSNQSAPPGAANTGTVNLYTKTTDKRLYYKDETGTEVGPLGSASGAQTNVANIFTAPQSIAADFHTKGPNPYADTSLFGIYFSVGTPPTITCNTTSGQSTISCAGGVSDFIVGHGVSIPRAGAAPGVLTPSAPIGISAMTIGGSNNVSVTTAGTVSYFDGNSITAAGMTDSTLNGTYTNVQMTGYNTFTATFTHTSCSPCSFGPGTFTIATPGAVTPVGQTGGTTAYNYEVVAVGFNRGLSAASVPFSTTTGAASLGKVSYTIAANGCVTSGGQTTVTTTAAHNIPNLADIEFNIVGGSTGTVTLEGAQLTVSTTSTTVTFNTQGQANGTYCPNGGTLQVMAQNVVKWLSQPGSTAGHIIYRCIGNIATTCASNSAYTRVGFQAGTDSSFFDWGMAAPALGPPDASYFPASPPAAPVNGFLQSTITNISGTTVTLANNAGASVTGATVFHDDVEAILAACNSFGTGGAEIYSPGPGTAILNSPLDLRACSAYQPRITFASQAFVNEPIVPKNGSNFSGSPIGNFATSSPFQTTFQAVLTGDAYPIILMPLLTPNGGGLSGVQFNNLILQVFQSYQNAIYFDQDSLGDNVTTTTFNNVGILGGACGTQPVRLGGGFGLYVNGGTWGAGGCSSWGFPPSVLDTTNAGLGMNQQQLAGIWIFNNTNFAGGEFKFTNPSGVQCGAVAGHMTFIESLYESGFYPEFTFDTPNCGLSGFTAINPSYADELGGAGTPIFNLGASVVGSIKVIGAGINTCGNGAQPLFSAPSTQSAELENIGCSIIGLAKSVGFSQTGLGLGNTSLLVTGTGQVDYGISTPGAPTVAISGTSGPGANTYYYSVTAVDVNGGNSTVGPPSSGITVNGAQGVLVTFPSYVVGQVATTVCRGTNANGVGAVCAATGQNGAGVTGTTFLDNGGFFPTSSANFLGGGGATILGPAGLSSSTIQVVGSAGSKATIAGTYSANRNDLLPDVSGVFPVTGYINSAYDNATRANGAIGSNWTVGNDSINISGNAFIGNNASAHNVQFWSANPFSNFGQFAEVTVATLNGTSDFVGVAVLVSSAGNAYTCIEDSTNIFLQRLAAGTGSNLTSSAITGAAGDVLRLEVIEPGGALTCYRNGAIALTATDTTFTTGAPGLDMFNNVATAKDWTGGNLHPLSQLDVEADYTKVQHLNAGVGIGTETFTASPRGEQNVFLPSALTSTWTGATWTTDKAVTVTRVQVQAKTAPAGCTTNAIVRLTDGSSPVNVTIAAAASDSGPIAQNYAAGAALTIGVQTAAAGCTTSPADANVVVQYRMQ